LSLRYDEIGKRLKAFRLGSRLSVDDIARRLEISRTALYRFEKGELAKIETLEKLAELLGVSVPTLLGVGTEYIGSAVSYFERIRQIEEEAQSIISLAGPIPSLLASDAFAETLRDVLCESIPETASSRGRVLADVDTIMDILRQRKQAFLERKPSMVKLLSALDIERFLSHGFVGRSSLSPAIQKRRKAMAREEVMHFATLIEAAPMGVQVGIVPEALPHTGFQIYGQADRRILTTSPFRLGEQPNIGVGVAMITSAPEALQLHDRAVQEMWRSALKGEAAAKFLRKLLGVRQRS
jgi:transcriptional regulator with XRE-family HTH domain